MVLRAQNKGCSGLTLIELMVGLAVSGIVAAALASAAFYFSRSSSAIFNYAVINSDDRSSIEAVGRDIREAQSFARLTPTNIVLFVNSNAVELRFDPMQKKLRRVTSTTNKVLLSGCSGLRFTYYERTTNAQNFENLLVSTSTNWRVVQMNWLSTVYSNAGGVFTVSNSAKFLNRRPLQSQ
jgi:prepilin-type N-terminal cleavage/methylation domain-containing protein